MANFDEKRLVISWNINISCLKSDLGTTRYIPKYKTVARPNFKVGPLNILSSTNADNVFLKREDAWKNKQYFFGGIRFQRWQTTILLNVCIGLLCGGLNKTLKKNLLSKKKIFFGVPLTNFVQNWWLMEPYNKPWDWKKVVISCLHIVQWSTQTDTLAM